MYIEAHHNTISIPKNVDVSTYVAVFINETLRRTKNRYKKPAINNRKESPRSLLISPYTSRRLMVSVLKLTVLYSSFSTNFPLLEVTFFREILSSSKLKRRFSSLACSGVCVAAYIRSYSWARVNNEEIKKKFSSPLYEDLSSYII